MQPAAAQVRLLHHTPPVNAVAQNDLVLNATPMSEAAVLEGKLYYRLPGSTSFVEQDFQELGFYYRAIIPGDKITTAGLEYVVVFRFADGSIASYPTHDPFENPYSLTVLAGKTVRDTVIGSRFSGMVDIMILSPEPNEILDPNAALVAVSFFNAPEVNMATVKLFLDGMDVTNQAFIADGILSYNPEKLLGGLHQVEIRMSGKNDKELQPVSWSFLIGTPGPGLAEYFEYRGQIESRLSSEEVAGIPLDVAELSGDLEADVKWAKFRSRFRVTTRETPFRQPQNRMGTSLSFGRFLNIDMGDFNPHFTPFTIDGKRVRGLAIDADLDWVRFQFVKGELNRAIQQTGRLDGGYRLLSEETVTDSTGLSTFYLDRKGYSFKRNLLAVRFSIDLRSKFMFGLHLLQVRDDVNSLQANLPEATFTVDTSITGIDSGIYTYEELRLLVSGQGDSLSLADRGWRSGDPKDNLVLGFNLGTSFDQKKLTLDFNWNMSLFNRNIWDGAMSRAEMDTALDDSLDGKIGVQYKDGKPVSGGTEIDTAKIIIDPLKFEKLFTINTNMSPLIPIDITTIQSHPITSIINMPSSAFNFRIRGHYSNNNFVVEYRQVGPKYVSLGNPFLRINIREFSITDRVSLLDHKLLLSGGFKHQDNKILKTVVDPLSTNTFTLSMTILPGPGLPSFMLNYQSVRKNNGKTELDTLGVDLVDLREDSKAANNMMAVTLPFTYGGVKHNLSLNYSGIINIDQLVGRRSQGYLFPKTDTKTFSVNLSSSFSSPLSTIFSFSQTKLLIPFKDRQEIKKIPYIWTSGALTGQYAMLQNKLRLSANLSFLNSQGAVHSQVYGLRGGAGFLLRPNLVANLSGTFLLNFFPDYKSDGIDNNSNGETDETGEYLEVNTSGIILTIKYNF